MHFTRTVLLVLPLLIRLARSQATSYDFPFSRASSINRGFHINASIADGPTTTFLIDTGSTGIVIAAQYVGTSYTTTGDSFCFTYSSSNNSYRGDWILASVVLSSGDVEAATQMMPVRMVTEFCPGSGGSCTTDASAIEVTMMGVGFDRGSANGTDSCGNPMPSGINPFLALEEMGDGGSMVPGYIIAPSTRTITLGITDDNSADFELVQLVAQSSSDWIAPMVEVAVPTGNFSAFNASLLIDTGLSYSIVQAPLNANLPETTIQNQTEVASGQEVVLTLPGLSQSLYDFDIGDKGVAPTYVSWRHFLHDGVAFINTGRFALSQFDYLYNDGAGQLGFMFV